MFQPGNPGRPKGAKSERTKIADLFSEIEIKDALREQFHKRDKLTLQFIFEHWFGKPENTNINKNITYPDFIRIVNGPQNDKKEEIRPENSNKDPGLRLDNAITHDYSHDTVTEADSIMRAKELSSQN